MYNLLIRLLGASIAAVLVGLALTCAALVGQDSGEVQIAYHVEPVAPGEEPLEWGQWYQHAAACTGLSATVEQLKALRWYRAGAIFPEGHRVSLDDLAEPAVIGSFYPASGSLPPRILLVWNYIYNERAVEHELFHYMLWLASGDADSTHGHEAWTRCSLL